MADFPARSGIRLALLVAVGLQALGDLSALALNGNAYRLGRLTGADAPVVFLAYGVSLALDALLFVGMLKMKRWARFLLWTLFLIVIGQSAAQFLLGGEITDVVRRGAPGLITVGLEAAAFEYLWRHRTSAGSTPKPPPAAEAGRRETRG